MKGKRKNISIKTLITIVFMLSMLVSIGAIGYLIFTNWLFSAMSTTENIAEDLNENIYNQIYSFIDIPNQINETNHKIIAYGILDLNNEILREKFFVGVLSSLNNEIYSFSFGTVNGEYYGARRNEKGEIEIMKNDASTGGNSWYYSVNDDMTAGAFVVDAGKFDPRTRAWYKMSVETGGPAFSPVYKHFVMDDLTVSFACPVYDEAGNFLGVLATHILLTDIGTYLKEAVSKYNGYAIIIENDTNKLIANSMGIENFSVLPDGTLERNGVDKIEHTDLKEAYKRYIIQKNPSLLYDGKDEDLFVNVKGIHMKGLDWVVISAIPERLLIAPVAKSIHLAVLLTVLALLLFFTIYTIITGRLLKPMNMLLQASEALSSGNLEKRVEIVRNDEIGRISEAFNNVADRMQFLINNLENAVEERTKELHKAYGDLEESKNQLQYLSCHDTLTGLHNRRCFEENREKIDIPDNLPLSVIFADINGLKMTNDIFGHVKGDELIKKSAEIFVQSCRENDFIARVGGDEFIILLPNTSEENAEKVVSQINSGFSDARVEAIKCSVSIGYDTKTSHDQSLDEIMANAENKMYKDKIMNRKSINMDIIETIIETLHSRSSREKQHSVAVSGLCGEIGSALQLSQPEINKLIRAGYLHDIGKITLDDNLLARDGQEAEESEEIRQHSVVGYRILNLFDDTLDLAEYIYSHHEKWDGSGYPRGLKGEQIHLIARIISIAETYDRILNRGNLPLSERKKKAIEEIKESAGKQFDPALAELFVKMMGDNN